MIKEYNDLFNIIRSSIYNTDLVLEPGIDWARMLELLSVGKLIGITINKIAALPAEIGPAPELLAPHKSTCMRRTIHQNVMMHELGIVVNKANKTDIPYIVFKGPAVADLYPNPKMRFSSDADIYVPGARRADMVNLLESIGFVLVPEHSKEHVPNYIKPTPTGGFMIELHDQLWEDYKGPLADALDSLNITDINKTVKIDVCGVSANTLGHEEQLIFLLFHMAKHFALEKMELRHLTDLTLFVNAHIDSINLKSVDTALKKMKFTNFAYMIFKLCVDELGMTPVINTYAPKAVSVSEVFLKDIIEPHKQFNDVNEGYTSIRVTIDYFMQNRDNKYSTFGRYLHRVFPTPSELSDDYTYAKRCVLLLPFAWIHHAVNAFKFYLECKKKGFSSMSVYEKGEDRLRMMEEAGLSEKK